MIAPVGGTLARGLTELDAGEEWLVEPRQLDGSGRLWRPGVRLGVRQGSWFQQTECFGPVLGLIEAPDLEAAIAIQNATGYGLTAGLHTLDPAEAGQWLDEVEAGNAYVNKPITGAIVHRQPFGGWKQSSVGPGAKAGGPNYVMQLGTWHPRREPGATGQQFLIAAAASDHGWWSREFAVEHDPAGLFCEANLFRYRPLPMIAIRVGAGTGDLELERVLAAAAVCGVPTLVSPAGDEPDDDFLQRVLTLGLDRVRALGEVSYRLRQEAAGRLIHIADDPVTANGRIELRHYLREQSVSRSLHRFGNLVAAD
jgi:RHH-type proline utilization regulon transcriptional repressor/proline dehydrogenase/delta 1-pyrroline-5-carboxylate dehydrogenase